MMEYRVREVKKIIELIGNLSNAHQSLFRRIFCCGQGDTSRPHSPAPPFGPGHSWKTGSAVLGAMVAVA